MNMTTKALGVLALTAAGTAAFADGRINVDINPFGWGAPPPVVYEPPDYYAPPPVIYNGRGDWGDRHEGWREHRDGYGREYDHGGYQRDRGDGYRGHREHHDEGERDR